MEEKPPLIDQLFDAPLNFSMTQAMRMRVLNSNDSKEVMRTLVEHNETQDKKLMQMEAVLKELAWYHSRRVTEEKLDAAIKQAFKMYNDRYDNLKFWFIACLIPVAGASVAIILKLLKVL